VHGYARQENGAWRRVIVDKPFVRDLDAARALNKEIQVGARPDPDLPNRSLTRQRDRVYDEYIRRSAMDWLPDSVLDWTIGDPTPFQRADMVQAGLADSRTGA
jgi:Glucose-6-phosphate dehydrogenase, NAD binding domain